MPCCSSTRRPTRPSAPWRPAPSAMPSRNSHRTIPPWWASATTTAMRSSVSRSGGVCPTRCYATRRERPKRPSDYRVGWGLLRNRVTFVIDKQGHVQAVIHGRFQAEHHVREALKALGRLTQREEHHTAVVGAGDEVRATEQTGRTVGAGPCSPGKRSVCTAAPSALVNTTEPSLSALATMPS